MSTKSATVTSTEHPAPPRPRRETALAVGGLMLALFLVSLDQTVVGTAMPRVIADLKGFDQYAWVTTIYLLAQTSVIPIVGKLGDLYGRKWLTVAGVVIFLVGSVLCGAANSMLGLIAFRGIQGLGAGMLMATVFTLIADIFPDPAQRARFQGLFTGVFAISSVIGPVLGGWLTDALSWRWVFYVNLPVGLIALAALPFVLPQGQRRPGAKIDYLGAVTITVAVVSLLLALTWVGQGQPWTAGPVVAGLAVAAAAVLALIPIERRAPEPVIPFALFRERTFAVATAVLFFVGMAMFGVILYTPLLAQAVLGQSATGSGALMTPMVLTMTATSIVGGQLIARVGRIKPFLLFGAAMMTAGVALLTLLGLGSTVLMVTGCLVVIALGLGLVMPTMTLAVQTAVDRRQLGVATSATQFIRSIGATVGTAAIGTLVTAGYLTGLTNAAPAGLPQPIMTALHSPDILVSPAALADLTRAATGLPGGAAALDAALAAARVALAGAIHQGFLCLLVVTALAAFIALLLPDLRLDRRPTAAVRGGDPAPSRPVIETIAD